MTFIKNTPWDIKYQPTKLSEFIFETEYQSNYFKQVIESKSIPHLLFYGPRGTGKTTLAHILIKGCEVDPLDVKVINASDENRVEVIRDVIKDFITTSAMGEYKVVLLDEADYISLAGQAVLRAMMLEYADVASFILTANYIHKLIPELRSRCEEFHMIAGDKNTITEMVVEILLKEKVKLDSNALNIVDNYVNTGYPDIRKIVKLTQQHTINGKLVSNVIENTAAFKSDILNGIVNDNWMSVKDIATSNISNANEYEEIYRLLYDNLHLSKKFTNLDNYDAGIITIAEFLYRHYSYSDSEINFAACIISLKQIGN